MDKNKPQPKTFRITEETADKFKEISQSMGANQQQALAKLIEVYEMEMGKEHLPEMRENIDTFEGYLHAAASMYMQMLEANQNMRTLVRTEYDSMLKSKDLLITELQERVQNAEASTKQAKITEKNYQETIANLKEEISVLNGQIEHERSVFHSELDTCAQRYDTLNRSHSKLQNSEQETRTMLSVFMTENEKLKTEHEELRKTKQSQDEQHVKLTREHEILNINFDKLKTELSELLESKAVDFEHYKKQCDIEHQLHLQITINEIKEKHKEEVDALRIEINYLRNELDRYKELYYKGWKEE